MGHQCVLTHREKDEWAINAYLLIGRMTNGPSMHADSYGGGRIHTYSTNITVCYAVDK